MRSKIYSDLIFASVRLVLYNSIACFTGCVGFQTIYVCLWNIYGYYIKPYRVRYTITIKCKTPHALG